MPEIESILSTEAERATDQLSSNATSTPSASTIRSSSSPQAGQVNLCSSFREHFAQQENGDLGMLARRNSDSVACRPRQSVAENFRPDHPP
jgi:hypothetical protein